MIFGGKRKRAAQDRPQPHAPEPLIAVTVAGQQPTAPRNIGRRTRDFTFERLIVPTLVLDHTFLSLRQMGVLGCEKFLVWAGTIAGSEAFVSTIVTPRTTDGALHGEVPPAVVARVFEALDTRDLVPLAQVHSHPEGASMSATDRERPLFAFRGFWSLIIPSFGFVPPGDVTHWSVYEYRAKRHWHELDEVARADRIVIDDSLIRVE